MPLLEKGCFCCQLKTCVRVQGYISAIFGAIAIVLVSYAMVSISNTKPEDMTKDPEKVDEMRGVLAAMWTLLIVVLVSCIVSVLLAVLLLAGTYTKRRGLIMPYMIVAALNIIVNLCLMFAMLSTAPASAIVSQVISIGLSAYCWVHVLSYYQELKEQEGAGKFTVSHGVHKV